MYVVCLRFNTYLTVQMCKPMSSLYLGSWSTTGRNTSLWTDLVYCTVNSVCKIRVLLFLLFHYYELDSLVYLLILSIMVHGYIRNATTTYLSLQKNVNITTLLVSDPHALTQLNWKRDVWIANYLWTSINTWFWH